MTPQDGLARACMPTKTRFAPIGDTGGDDAPGRDGGDMPESWRGLKAARPENP